MKTRKKTVKKILLMVFCIGILNICFNNFIRVYAKDEKVEYVETNGSVDSSSIEGYEYNTDNHHLYYHYTSKGIKKTLDYGEATGGPNGTGDTAIYKWKIKENSEAWKQATADGLTDITTSMTYSYNRDQGRSTFKGLRFFHIWKCLCSYNK